MHTKITDKEEKSILQEQVEQHLGHYPLLDKTTRNCSNMGLPKKGSEGISRAERKAKKRKIEDTIPDLPGDEQILQESVDEPKKKRKRSSELDESLIDEEKKAAKKEKKRKKAEDGGGEEVDKTAVKKAKKEKKAAEEVVEEPAVKAEELIKVEEVVEEAPRKSKKERKAERKALEAAVKKDAPVTEDSKPAAEVDGEESKDTAEKAKKNNRNREKKRKAALENGETAEKTPDRFIVFVGESE